MYSQHLIKQVDHERKICHASTVSNHKVCIRSNSDLLLVVRNANESTWKAETCGSLSLRPASPTCRVLSQPVLHRETLSQNKTKGKKCKNQNVFGKSGVKIGIVVF